MAERESIVRKASKYLSSHMALVVFGAVASIGGLLSIGSLVINLGINAIVVADGFSVVGKSFLPHAIAIGIGALVACIVILYVSGFAQAILLKVVGAGAHGEDDVWYGALRRGISAALPLMYVWMLFYIAIGLFTYGVYYLALVVLNAVASVSVSVVISVLAILLIAFLVTFFAIIAMNASCFVSMYRLKTWKAIASGFDLFVQMQLRSLGMMALLVLLWIASFAVMFVACGLIAFVAVWLAHFAVSPEHLARFLSDGLYGNGLLKAFLLGILFLTNTILTAFGDVVWALFFLDHVSSLQLPKKKVSHEDVMSAFPEVETA
jgi:hypothetical protein